MKNWFLNVILGSTQFARGMFLVSLLWRVRLDDIILKLFQRSRDWETRGGRTRPEGRTRPGILYCKNDFPIVYFMLLLLLLMLIFGNCVDHMLVNMSGLYKTLSFFDRKWLTIFWQSVDAILEDWNNYLTLNYQFTDYYLSVFQTWR